MREIKFRGKRVDNGEWVYGLFTMTKWHDMNAIENKGTWHEPIWELKDEYKHMLDCSKINRSRYWFAAIQQSKNFDSIVEVDPETVGQFTGLKTDTEKEVYEGDIISIPLLMSTIKDSVDVVELSNGAFHLMISTDILICQELMDEGISVLGNIYENPELLS